MARLIILASFLSIFSSVFLFSNPIKINNYKNGVNILISDLEFKVINKQKKTGIQFSDISDNQPNSEINLALEELSFLIAVPEEYEVNFFEKNSRRIGNYDIGSQEEIFNQKFTFDKNSTFNLTPQLFVSDIGSQRGFKVIEIRLQPFNYNRLTNETSLITDAIIEVKFKNALTSHRLNLSENELAFLSGIKNLEQISFFPQSSETKESVPSLLNDNWYDNSKHYVRIATHKDGIAKIKASDIIAGDNDFSGKEIKYLHLLHNGEEYPFYVFHDNDNILSSDDEFIFLGKRADGDTTWFDNYTDEESFFIYYDNQTEGQRLKLIPQITPKTIIEKVVIDKHIEKDLIYDVGFPQDNIEVMPGEGWCWQILTPNASTSTGKQFVAPVFLTPTDNAEDSLAISCFYASSRWDIISNVTNHKLSYLINSDTVSTIILNGGDRGFFTKTSSPNNLLSGTNKLEVNTFGILKSDSTFKLPDETIIDFIRIEGVSKPFANQSYEEFKVVSPKEDASISIPNFNEPFVVAIDSAFNKISFPKTKTGTSVRIGALTGKIHGASIIINDSLLFNSTDEGLFIGISGGTDNNYYNSKYFNSNSFGDAYNYLNDLKDGTIICIAYNSGNSNLPENLKSLIAGFGSKTIQNVNVSSSWSFAVVKGSPETVKEKLSPSGTANLSEFISNSAGKSYCAILEIPGNSDYHFIINDSSKIEIARAYSVNFSDLRKTDNRYDYIIIAHPNFTNVAEKIKSHRLLTNPKIKTKIVDVFDIYKEFKFGKKSPHAIRNFLKYTYNSWKKPAPLYVLLLGDASYDCRKIMSTTKLKDFIPAYGWPASDFWFTLLDGNDNLAEMEIGRLPITKEQQGMDYLDKLIEYDTIPNNPWMKKFLFLTGGSNDIERNSWFTLVNQQFVQDIIQVSDIGAETYIIPKKDPSVGGESEANEIISKINEGQFWVSYLGHGSPTVFEMDGWQVDKLNNKGRYGFFTTMSCNTADFAQSEIQSRNEDYILEPKKGFIGSGGSSNFSLVDVTTKLQYWMLKGMADRNSVLRTFCDVLNFAKSKTVYSDAELYITQQYTYLGEPLASLRGIGSPDLYLMKEGNDIKIESSSKAAIISEEDSSLQITGNVYNAGYKSFTKTRILLIHKFDNFTENYYYDFNNVSTKNPFNFTIPIYRKPGLHSLTLIVDPDSLINDPDRSNNKVELSVHVFTLGLYPLDPLSNWNVDSSNPEFRFINPLLNTSNNEFSYIFKIFKSPDSLNKPLLSSKDNEITENESFVEWRIGKSLLPERNYWITSQLINKTTGKSSAIQILPFHSANLSLVDSVIYIVSGANLRNSMTVSDLNVNSSGDTVYLKLADTLKSYQVKSARGGTVKNPERKSEIFYDGIYTFTTPPDDLGFKVVRVSGKDFLVKQAKKFDTWGDALYPMSDSNSVKLVEFLKDSVEIGDYVMLATHGESFRLPQIWQANKPESNGSLDSLRAILREYGSVLADSITWGYSFAMVGKKGDKRGSANEMASDSGEGIEISGNINKYGRFGSVVSNRIGPAKKWGRLDITGYFPFEKNALKNYLKIWVSLNGTSAKFLKYQIDSIANINLDTIANGYPYLWIETGFGRESENIDPYFTALKCGFIPTEEFTLVKSQTGLKADTVMRGDSVGLSFTARNISKRVSSDSNTIMVRLGTKTGEVEKLLIPQKILNSDEIGSHFIYLVTDNYNSSNELVLNVNPEEKPEELYSFNNQFSSKLDVTKDSVKPHIKLYFDSIEVHNGDYVAKQPNIKIDILDNSQLPISSINKVEVYINGRWQDPSKMNFKSFGRDIPLKATVKFLSDSLEFGDNIIRIYSSDATGNRDTLIVAVYVSLNWFIVNTDIYPNPMMEQSRIEFVLKAPRNEGMTQVTFFNLEGQKIRTLKQPSTIGKNSIAWDGKDEWGNSIPTGLYSYLVQVLTEDYIEPVKKKLVIIR